MSSKKELEKFREAREIARGILAGKLREALGKYYILWSAYPLLVIFLQKIISYVSPSFYNSYFYSLIVPVIFFVYSIYSFILFYRAKKEKAILKYDVKGSSLRFNVIFFSIGLAILAAIFILIYVFANDVFNIPYIYDLIGFEVIGLIIAYLIYQAVRDTGRVRYYDYLAIFTFLTGFLLSPLPLPEIIGYIASAIFFFVWLYAGLESLAESGVYDEREEE